MIKLFCALLLATVCIFIFWQISQDEALTPLIDRRAIYQGIAGWLGIFFLLSTAALIRTIQRHQQIEVKLRLSEKNYASLEDSYQTIKEIFDAANDMIVVTNTNTGEILMTNRQTQDVFGYSQEEFNQLGFCAISSPEHAEDALRRFHLTISECPQFFELETKDRFGQCIILEVNTSPVKIQGQPRCLALMRDITQRKAMEQKVKFLSLHDPLTGIYNRVVFEEELLRLQSKQHTSIGVGVFLADVDGLKMINDTLGHQQGDKLLKRVSKILNDPLSPPDFTARVGGDEFAVVLFEPTRHRMETLEKHYRKEVEKYNDKNRHIPLSLSIGWSADFHGTDIDKAFKEADHNMYREKVHQSRSVHSSIVQTMMKALEEKDHITEGHTDRLGTLLEKLGHRLNFSRAAIADLQLFARFHDIGKVGIPDSILKKAGSLNENEMSIMRRHCEIGFRIARSSPDLEPISDWVLKHQEHWDGKGYPLGLSGENIPIECRILAIADAFDAMTNDRPYRKAMGSEAAIREIKRCAGTQFDPRLVEIFIDLLCPDSSK